MQKTDIRVESGDTTPIADFWIDVGGTFTDCIALLADGTLRVHKLLSTGAYKGRVAKGSSRAAILDPRRRNDPHGFFRGFILRLGNEKATVASFDAASGTLVLERPLETTPALGTPFELLSGEEAPVTGIRYLLGVGLIEPLGPIRIRLGTTRGTNALLEHKGAPTAFVTTRGFGDVLLIAYQNRPRLFDLDIHKPVPLYREAVELIERIDASGTILTPLDEEAARKALHPLPGKGIRTLAVCLMNAYRNPVHEERVLELARDLGFEQISLSSRLAPSPKIVSRSDTTVVDAYLGPVIRSYVAGIRAKAPEARIHLMNSAGALTDAATFVGKDSIFSGPAGGVVGFARVAGLAGFDKAVGFDMGGTSTDVSRFDGEFERRFELEVSDPDEGVGVRVLAPMLAIETVAAGGGSICRFDGQKPVVGPDSAGADPGPACYGRGGPLTVTDINFVLGRILPDHFAFPLDRDASLRALDDVTREIEERTGVRYAREILAEGFRRIANANMEAPIKKVSLARGIDVRDYVLVSFGGAGGQHACAVARSLGMRKVLVPALDGVLSAYGIGMADIRRFGERHLGSVLDPGALGASRRLFRELEAALGREVREEGVPDERILPARRQLDLRYLGQDTALTVPEPENGNWREAFEDAHRRLYGFAFPDREVEIVTVRAEVTGAEAAPAPSPVLERHGTPEPLGTAPLFAGGARLEAGVFRREELRPGDALAGPALVLAPIGTTVVDPGFHAEVTALGDLLLTDEAGPGAQEEVGTGIDPIMLEIFNNHFASIAEQMGALLRKTAVSTNVKERLDFSCALFDASGELVVNAPHIPVHLGAMGECVKALMEDVPDFRPGDVFVTNDPYRGGSHLPDVTVVTPVHEIPNPKSQIPTKSQISNPNDEPETRNLKPETTKLLFLRRAAPTTRKSGA